MFYYKVLNLNEEGMGAITSFDLRYFNDEVKRMLCCNEKLAQYIYLNDSFYRVESFNNELPYMQNKYPEVLVRTISEEEYFELKQQNSNENN